jgi:hypothetical protein
MRVYHFLNKQYGIENLKNRRLKIAEIMSLNDPFELLGINLSDPSLRRAVNETKKTLSKKRGIICFSKSWRNPVQWSHYSDKHKGICIGFDVPDKHLMKVDYVRNRLNPAEEIDEQFMLKLLATKFSHWRYEQEYRAFVPLETKVDGYYFEEFSSELIPKQVIVGAMSDIYRAEIDQALGSIKSSIEVFKVRPAFRTFRIVKQEKESLWA